MLRVLLYGIGLWITCSVTTVQAQLHADFSSPITEVCAPELVQLSDASTTVGAPIVQWEWLLNGVVFSNLQNPALFLGQPGTYSLCLHVEDAAGNRDTLCRPNFFVAYRSPSVHYGINATLGCTPFPVQFTDSTTLGDAPIRQWRWDFGDGALDTILASPNHPYTTMGTFDVTLVAIDTNGCSDALLRSNAITVHQTPTASITQSTFSPLCGLPASIAFTGQSSTAGASYSWDLGDNRSAVGQNVTHQYLQAGCYTPTLTVSNSGCTVTVTTTNCLTVAEAPTADFTISDHTHCQVPFTVQMTNQSTNANSYVWNFGDSAQFTTTIPNPTYTYNSYFSSDTLAYSPGVFAVILTATNAAGCVDQDTQFIYASQIRAGIDGGGTLCAPDSAYYRANYNNISSVFTLASTRWNLQGGLPSTGRFATAYYPDSGAYRVRLWMTDNIGCQDSTEYNALIGIPPTIDSVVYTPTTICRIEGVRLQAYGSDFVNAWNWSFDDNSTGIGPLLTHNFVDTGSIGGTLVANFRGCIDTLSIDSFYVLLPVAKATTETECGQFTVNFRDESLGPHRWFWNFGDTTTSADTSHFQHSSYTYPGTGVYHAILTVYNDSTGCVDSTTITVILSDPQALFDIPDSLCTVAQFIPTNQSLEAIGYRWEAPGSAPYLDTDPAPLLEYRAAGVYPLTLYAYGSGSCYDSLTRFVTIAGIDTQLVHLPIPACRPTNITFIDRSQGIASPIVGRQWGTGGTDSTTTRVYPFPGPQPMPLQVTNSWGCVFNIADTVAVGGAFINFNSARDVCLGQSTNLIAITSSPANANAYRPFTYIWDFGDGTRDTSRQTVIFHTYQRAGVFDVCLDVVDQLGCVSTFCKTNWIEVHDPSAEFAADTFFSSCPPLEVNFSQLQLNGQQWSWWFGDGSTSGLSQPAHVYSTAGFYDVVLRVEAFPGCFDIDTIRQMIQIAGPTGAFPSTEERHCMPHTVTLTGSGDNIAQYTWLFGNGDFQTNAGGQTDTVQYTYTQPGRYGPILVIDDGMGCQISIPGDTIELVAPPQAQFTHDSLVCLGTSVQYQADGAAAQWDSLRWTFDGGWPQTTQQNTISVRYDSATTFSAQLIAWQNGCPDTLFRPQAVTLQKAPQAMFQVGRTDSCAQATVQLLQQSTTTDSLTMFWWNWGAGDVLARGDTAWTQGTADTVSVRLIATSTLGCTDTATQFVVFYPSPVVQVGLPPIICLGDSALLQANSNAPYVWLQQGITIHPHSGPLSVLANGIQTYIVRATTVFGCQAQDSLTLAPLPYLNVTLDDSLQLCLGDSVQLVGRGDGSRFLWSGGSTLSCSACPAPWAAPIQTTRYYAQLDTAYACLHQDSLLVQVLPLPIPAIIADSSLCAGDTLTLQASGGVAYRWFPSSTLSDSTAAATHAFPNHTTRYRVWIQDANGCTAWAEQWITVRLNTALPLPDTSICVGDRVQLSLLGNGSNPQWQGLGLSCNACPTPSLLPTSNVRIFVQYTNTNNCPVEDSLWIRVTDPRSFAIATIDSACLGDSLVLQAFQTQGAPVMWSSNSGSLSTINDSTALLLPTNDGWLYARLTLDRCAAEDSLLLTVLPPTFVSALAPTYCLGDSSLLEATGNATTYQWSPATYLNQDHGPLVTVSAPVTTTYQVVGAGRCGLDTAHVQAVVQAPPTIQVDTLVEAQLGETITLQANSRGNLTWSPANGLSCTDCPNPTWVVDGDATFYILATDDLGCFQQDSILVRVKSRCVAESIFVPSAFSPDGDGYNDILRAEHGGNEVLLRFEIYDRWGERVFTTEAWEQGWNGQFRGLPLTPDVYGYVLFFECPGTGERLLKKGNITLLR